jgi:hypothetical protein
MITTQVGTLEEIIQFTPTEELELLAALVADRTIWELQGFYGRLGGAALEAGLITPEGRVTEEGYALAAGYEESMAEEGQRLIVGGADESVPGPFATPNVHT